jgi:predicted HTH transcriptional regulator
MTTHDHTTLTALMKAYEYSIVFEESVPSPLSIAKMFTQMRWSNGGLVLLGVRRDGFIIGINPDELDGIYDRFERLCREMTRTRIELGTLILGDRVVVFMAFNTIQRHLAPLRHYSRFISNTRFI